MNVAILSLSGAADDDSLSCALTRVPKSCILVIEDIDHYQFDEGSPDKKDDGKIYAKSNSISVSGILNAIDGIASLKESSKCSLRERMYMRYIGAVNLPHCSHLHDL